MKNRVIKAFSWIFFFVFVTIGIWYGLRHNFFKQAASASPSQLADTTAFNNFLKEGDFYFHKSERSNNDLDSSVRAIHKGYQLSTQLNYKKGIGLCLDRYSKIYNVRGDTLAGRQFADSAINVFKENNLFYELGFAYYNRSGFYPLDNKLIKIRIEYVKLAAKAFTQSGSKLKQADILKELADLQQYNLNFREALVNLQQSLLLYKLVNYKEGLVGVYDLLGDVSSTLGNHRLALKYGLLAIKTSEELNDSISSNVATLYNRIGITYERMRKYSLAYDYFNKGQRLSLMNKDSTKWILITNNKAKMLYLMGRTKDGIQCVQHLPSKLINNDHVLSAAINCFLLVSYLKLKDDDKSKYYYQRLLKEEAYAKQMELPWTSVYGCLARYYIAYKEFDKAQEYLKLNEGIYKRFKVLPELTDTYWNWAKLDSANDNLTACVQHLKRYQFLHDSLLNERSSEELAQLQIEYDTEKKDKDILLKAEHIKVLNAENQIQIGNVKQARLTRNVTIGGIFLLLIIIILLYTRYQFKNRINRTISLKNESLNQLVTEKEWLLKEIHHRVKNNLQIIISLLDSQSMYLHDNAALSAIRDSQSRVHCMSLIHKKLYQNNNLSTINMNIYINELVEYLANAYDVQKIIRFELFVADVQLNVSQSIPIGLILNEAITNSIKYAFPAKYDERSIEIHLSVISNKCLLVIHDNGVGLPEKFDEENISSLGMSLMKGLSEDIDASFAIKNKRGTCIEITFDLTSSDLLSPLSITPLLNAELV